MTLKKFYGDWADYAEFERDFLPYDDSSTPVGFPTETEVAFASCREDSYEGACIVYFVRDGKLYEYADSHCSCNAYSEGIGDLCAARTPITSQYLTFRERPYGIDWDDPHAQVAWDALLVMASELDARKGGAK